MRGIDTRLACWIGIGAWVALGGSGCGGAAAEPVAQETSGEEVTPRSTFSGTWNGARFDARWAALGWQWPGGWTVCWSKCRLHAGDQHDSVGCDV